MTEAAHFAEVIAEVMTEEPNGRDTQPTDKTIKLIGFRDLIAPDLTSNGLIKGFIDRGALAMVFGEPGCGKTFFALDMALALADGREWFGLTTKKARVVYLAAEAGKAIRNRVAAWANARWDQASDIDFRAIVSPVDLCNVKLKDAREIATTIGAGNVDVLVVDTVSRAMAGGDENSPADMGTFVNTMDKLRAYLGCAVIAIHHIGKDASRGARGHSLLKCAVDTEIAVERRDEGVITATVTKQRDMPGGMELAFRLVSVDLGDDQDGDPVRSCVIEPTEPPEKRRPPLTGHAKTALETLKRLVVESGTTRQTDLLGVTVQAVRVEDWRVSLEGVGKLGDGANFRNAWKRSQEKLLKDGHIELTKEWVWPVVQPEAF